MKGIIMAGGRGTRLYPSTIAVNKHLLPVYDKPMIYYSLSTLMLAGINDILIIASPDSLPLFQMLLKNGSQWGINLSYAIQHQANGIAEAFIIGEKFINDNRVCLTLGDNIFQGSGLEEKCSTAKNNNHGATLFAYHVDNPQHYGVVEFDQHKKPINLIEKPSNPKSNYAITGLYFYDMHVCEIARTLKPSQRGELEITDINAIYLNNNELDIQLFGRGFAWLDMGTHQSLLHAANFIEVMESRQGLKIGCPEEIAWRKGFIKDDDLLKLAAEITSTDYKNHLLKLLYT